jgi:soluble lytic murein transglycosylase-like protein
MKLRLIGSLLLILLTSRNVAAQELSLEAIVAERARRYAPCLAEAAAKHGVDARLLWVIAYLETRFNPRAISRKGARGMMQMMPATAARFGLKDVHDPAASSDAAARYVRWLLARFGGRVDLALAAYNAGEATVDAYLTGREIRAGNKTINRARRITGGVPPYHETKEYVANGLRLLGSALPASSSVILRKRSTQDAAAHDNSEKQISRASVRNSISYTAAEQTETASAAGIRRSISW